MKHRPKKVIIIGPYPPPYGGISVHVKRIFQHIKQYPVQIYDSLASPPSKQRPKNVVELKKIALVKLFFKPGHLIHYHSSSVKMRILLGFTAFTNPKIYIHIHGASLVDQLETKDFKSTLLKFLLKRVNLISSNPEIAMYVESNLIVRSHHQFDAFIPPLYNEDVVRDVLSFIEWPDSKYVISMGGWFASYNSEDLYGFDILLKALYKLRAKGLDISVVASVNGVKDQQLYKSFLEELDALSLTNDFILIMEDLDEFYPVLINSDIFVRPTNTDGNAVSIKEALWFDVPVLASDVVSRPQKAFTFKNRDIDDFTTRIEEILKISNVNKSSFDPEKKFEHPMIKEIYGFK